MSAANRTPPLDAGTVWHEFHGRLLGFITRRVPDRDSAEDVLQEVMLRIHRHAADLEHAPAVGAWVHQIARNAIADHYRRTAIRREEPAGIDIDAYEPVAPEPAAGAPRDELAACLEPLLERLPPHSREAIRLTELGGLTQTGAAGRLGLSSSGMKSRVQRARAQLRELLVDCCEIELDRGGRLTGYQPRGGRCECRSARTSSPTRSAPPSGPAARPGDA